VTQILVIDVGNSRMKWAMRGPAGWSARGAVANQDIGTLAVRDWQNLERPACAVGVNVAGEAARVRVEGQFARWRLMVEWLRVAGEGVKGTVAGVDSPGALVLADAPRRARFLAGEISLRRA